MSVLRLDRVSKSYGRVRALDSVTLELAAGSRTAIVGPSGSGKTTLLRLVAGFEAPDAGSITIDGEVVAADGKARPAHRREIGIVAQDGALFPHLTVAENIGFGLARAGRRSVQIEELARMVELDPAMLRRRPDELSGGQQQRVALARAMARRPRLMLLDEPFSALDAALRASTRQAVASLLDAAGIATILVTHDQAEALSFAEHVAIMRDGRILQAGTPQQLYYRPISPEVAAFIGDAIILPAEIRDGQADCALGRLVLAGPARDGTAEILLRPEQLHLEADLSASQISVIGRIAAVEFEGPLSQIVLELAGATIRVRQPSSPALRASMLVAVRVTGAIHAFCGAPMPDGAPCVSAPCCHA